MRPKLSISIGAFCLIVTTAAIAGSDHDGPSALAGVSVYDVALNDFMTNSIVRDLGSIRAECVETTQPYRLDCIRQGIELTARRTPYHGAYGPMRETLRDSGIALSKLVAAGADKLIERREVEPDTNPRFKARRWYTPISSKTKRDTTAAAFNWLEATQAKLLELASKGPDWNRPYTAVAVALAGLEDALRI